MFVGSNIFLNVSLEGQNEYKSKIKSVANAGKTDWVLAAMDGDSIGKIKNKSMVGAKYVIYLITNEVYQICDVYGKNICAGYLRGGDEFSILINCSDKKIAENVINQLIENVRNKGECTISAGLTFLKEDETANEWENRAEEALQKAKNNGKDQLAWV